MSECTSCHGTGTITTGSRSIECPTCKGLGQGAPERDRPAPPVPVDIAKSVDRIAQQQRRKP